MRYPASEKLEIIRLVEESTCRCGGRWKGSASRAPPSTETQSQPARRQNSHSAAEQDGLVFSDPDRSAFALSRPDHRRAVRVLHLDPIP
jgi:hypothetical protein